MTIILNASFADIASAVVLIGTETDGDVYVQDLAAVDDPYAAALAAWVAAGGVIKPFVPDPPIQVPKVLSRPDFVVALTTVPNPPIFDEAEALQALETFPPKFRAALAGRPLAYQAAAIEAWRETKTVARDAPLFLDLLAFYAAAAGLTEAQAAALGDQIFAGASNG